MKFQTGLVSTPDLESVGRIHEKVSPEIVEHDGVVLVVLRKLSPDDSQWFNLRQSKLSCSQTSAKLSAENVGIIFKTKRG